MKILVTGGAGFIGSHIVEAVVRQGEDVAVVDDLSAGLESNVPKGVPLYKMDIRSEQLADVLAEVKPEVVFHQAAQMNVTFSVSQPRTDADINILGSLNVLELCVRNGVKKIVYASSSGAVYGEPTLLPVTEAMLPAPVSHYGASKLSVEHYLSVYSSVYGLDYTILRYANVYGPRQLRHGEAGVVPILFADLAEGRKPTLYGMGEPVRDYVFAGDVARANMLALKGGSRDLFNIASGTGTSVCELFEKIAKLAGVEVKPALKPLRKGEVHSIYASAEKAREKLNWRPTVNLDEGLQATYEFFCRQRGGL
ncbi:MAG: GDP-mannose 4,6-dehydratase [Candidatus Hydrogenedentes bacterium]|nr:GDP-mannose 4,6-dehydratase [Candidatus Hydrogenedentota bacterium]